MKKVLKRSLSLLLAITIIFSSAYVGFAGVDFDGLFAVKAKAATSGTTGDCTWSLDGTVLTISGDGEMWNYYNSSSATPWGNQITKVVIGNSVSRIGLYAFYKCTNLTSVVIGDGVTSIGDWAFFGCTSLTSIIIPNGVVEIGRCAFSGCSKLSLITLPDSVTSIGDEVFSGTDYYNKSGNWYNEALYIGNHLIKVKESFNGKFVIKNGTKTIASDACHSCVNTTDITIPNTLTHIGSRAFYGCDKLTSITVPNNVISIGGGAFYECYKLASITIPNSVKDIGAEAFYGTAYYNNGNNWEGDSLYINGCLIGVEKSFKGNYVIKAGTRIIAASAFDECTKITNITIPNSVTSVGCWAFYGCISLTTITIPYSVASISVDAFYRCSGLSSINVDNKNKEYLSVDGVLFNKNKTNLIQYPSSKTLTEYIIPGSVINIEDYAFRDCKSLVSITMLDGLMSIGKYAFRDCINLTFVTLPDNLNNIDNGAFVGCDNLKHIIIPKGVKHLEDTFLGCDNLESITIPKSLVFIDSYTFGNCCSLKTVYYQGDENQWNNININESGNDYLLSAKIIPDNYLNFSNSSVDGFSFSNFMFNYYSHQDMSAPYQNYLNTFNSDFGSESMVCSAAGTKLEKDIDAWYTVKSVANPGNALNLLNYQQQYEMIIYGILFDTLSNEDLQSTSYSNAVTDVSKFTTDLVDKWNMADVLDKTDLTGAECQKVKDAAIAFIGNSDTKWTALGEYTSLLGKLSGTFDKFIKPGVDIYNVIQKVSMLNQLMNLGNEGISYLYLLKGYSTDPFMKSAIQEVIDSVSNDWVGIVEKVILDTGFVFGKAAISALVDAGWGAVCAVNPFLAGMAIGDVVGTFVCNVFLATEDTIEQYSNMKKIVEIKKSVRALQEDIDCICRVHANKDNTNIWVFSLGFMNSLLETDYKTSVEFCRIITQKGIVNVVTNLFSSKREQTFSEYKDTIEKSIVHFDSQYRFLFTNDTIKLRLCMSYPQHYSSCYPTPVSDFTYRVVNNTVTITRVVPDRYDVVIPDEIDGKPVTTLSSDIFENNERVGIVVFGNNILEIDGLFSYDVNTLDYIYVEPENKNYCSDNGVLFSKDKKTLYKCSDNISGTYIIPNGVTNIYYNAFEGCTGITSIIIPNSVTKIGNSAFKDCISLESITIPDSVTNIGDSALTNTAYYNNNLNWKDNVLYSGNHLIKAKPSINGLYEIKKGTKTIAEYAFYDCVKLKTLILPKSVKTIGIWAFGYCSQLSDVYYTGSLDEIKKMVIYATGNDCFVNATRHYNYMPKPATPKVSTTNEIGGVQVKWNAVAGATKYVVYRRQGGYKTWVNVGTTTGTTLLDKNVKSGIYYVYSVRAYNSDGQYSDFVTANTQTRKFMATPKLTTIYNHQNGLAIKWNAVAGVTKGYRVYRRGAGSTYWTYLGTTKNLYFIDSQVKNRNGEYFRYTVIADGDYHSKFDTTGLYLRRLANPTLNSAVSSKSGITVKWGKVAGSSGYYVYRKTANSTWTRIAVVKGVNGLSYLDKTAKKGTTYTYTVRAVYGNTLSSYYSGISCYDKY